VSICGVGVKYILICPRASSQFVWPHLRRREDLVVQYLCSLGDSRCCRRKQTVSSESQSFRHMRCKEFVEIPLGRGNQVDVDVLAPAGYPYGFWKAEPDARMR